MRLRHACALLAAILLSGPALAPLHAQASLNFERQRMKNVLESVSRTVARNFYDPEMRGVDWKALTADARERIDSAGSAGEMVTAIFALVRALEDSHTQFLPPGRVNRPLFGFDAKAFGEEIRVYEVEENSAAADAGLKPGDRILQLNGFDVDRSSFDITMLFFRVLRPVDRMEMILQSPGAHPRRLVVQARTKSSALVTDLTDSFNIWQLIRELEKGKKAHYAIYDGGIGYVQIPDFTVSEGAIRNLLGRVKDSRAVIVDLRGNPGGIVNRLATAAGYFESEPLVMAEMVGRRKPEPVRVRPMRPGLSGPMFILVDSQSASAAEMFARHFQRTGRAVVIGDRTSGRVTASHFYSMSEGAQVAVLYGVQVAVARVVFPGGEELERAGVTPDVRCLPTAEEMREEKDSCLNRAVSLARKALGEEKKTPAEEPAEEEEGS